MLRIAVPRALWATLLSAAAAHAEEMGTPPPDIDKVAQGPEKVREKLTLVGSPDGVTTSISAGALSSSGNSRLLAATASAKLDSRAGANAFGASAIANYGESAPPDGEMETTAENAQGRLRYDRFLLDDASVFLLVTGRHDRFQGLAFRLNVDPGFKYLFVNRPATALWAELGYDFQFDTRTELGRELRDAMGVLLETLDKTATDHSARSFIGFSHAFNDAVALSNGLEYLQSFILVERYRFNYDVLFTAKVWGNFSLGVGFDARYDNAPLPGKEQLDTSSSINLLYSYTNVVK